MKSYLAATITLFPAGDVPPQESQVYGSQGRIEVHCVQLCSGPDGCNSIIVDQNARHCICGKPLVYATDNSSLREKQKS